MDEDVLGTIDVEPIPGEYLALMIHDLTSHAHGIPGFFEWMRKNHEKEEEENFYLNYEYGLRQANIVGGLLRDFAERIDAEYGRLRLRVREIDLYDDVVRPSLDKFSPEFNEQGVDFLHKESVKKGEVKIYQDRKLLLRISENLIKNGLACGPETVMTYGKVMPVNSIDDEFPVYGGDKLKAIVWNTIPRPDEVKNGSGYGLKSVRAMILLLGGECPENIPTIYHDGPLNKQCARVEFTLPIDLREVYPSKYKPL
jgi:hypothetical protein